MNASAVRRLVVLTPKCMWEVWLFSCFEHKWDIDARCRRAKFQLFGLSSNTEHTLPDFIAYLNAWVVNSSYQLSLRICRVGHYNWLKIVRSVSHLIGREMACPSIAQVPCACLTMLNLTHVQNHLGFFLLSWEEWGTLFPLCVGFLFSFQSDWSLQFYLDNSVVPTWVLYFCITSVPYLCRNLLAWEEFIYFGTHLRHWVQLFCLAKMKWDLMQ